MEIMPTTRLSTFRTRCESKSRYVTRHRECLLFIHSNDKYRADTSHLNSAVYIYTGAFGTAFQTKSSIPSSLVPCSRPRDKTSASRRRWARQRTSYGGAWKVTPGGGHGRCKRSSNTNSFLPRKSVPRDPSVSPPRHRLQQRNRRRREMLQQGRTTAPCQDGSRASRARGNATNMARCTTTFSSLTTRGKRRATWARCPTCSRRGASTAGGT